MPSIEKLREAVRIAQRRAEVLCSRVNGPNTFEQWIAADACAEELAARRVLTMAEE